MHGFGAVADWKRQSDPLFHAEIPIDDAQASRQRWNGACL